MRGARGPFALPCGGIARTLLVGSAEGATGTHQNLFELECVERRARLRNRSARARARRRAPVQASPHRERPPCGRGRRVVVGARARRGFWATPEVAMCPAYSALRRPTLLSI